MLANATCPTQGPPTTKTRRKITNKIKKKPSSAVGGREPLASL